MNVNFNAIKFNTIQKMPQLNNNRVNFQAKTDSVELSADAKEKAIITKNLTELGYAPERASEMVKENYKQDYNHKNFAPYGIPISYDSLVNGDKDGNPVHFFGHSERNLTPTEAIVYMAENMHEFYYEHNDAYEQVRADYLERHGEELDECRADYSPVILANCMNQGLNMFAAGLFLNAEMDFDTAKRVSEYFTPEKENHLNSIYLLSDESICSRIADSLDVADKYVSDEKNPDGTLKSGLLRPLSKDEIYGLAESELLGVLGTDDINRYFITQERSCQELRKWFSNRIQEKARLDAQKEENSTTQAENTQTVVSEEEKSPKHLTPEFTDLWDIAHYCTKKYAKDKYDKEFFTQLKGLDSDKFYDRTSPYIFKSALEAQDMERRTWNNNVNALNSASDELLNKMATGSTDKKGKINSLGQLLKAKNLPERMEEMEEMRTTNPEDFNNMSKEEVVDYLTDSQNAIIE